MIKSKNVETSFLFPVASDICVIHPEIALFDRIGSKNVSGFLSRSAMDCFGMKIVKAAYGTLEGIEV